MQLIGEALKAVLKTQVDQVEVKDSRSFPYGEVSPARALALVETGSFAGVGNRRRIRFIRPLDCASCFRGSQTTERIRNAAGVIISPPWGRKHIGERA